MDRNSLTSKKAKPMKMKKKGNATKTNGKSQMGCLIENKLMMLDNDVLMMMMTIDEFGICGVKSLKMLGERRNGSCSPLRFFLFVLYLINYLMNFKIEKSSFWFK